MGCERGQADQSAAAHGLRALSDRDPADQLSELCTTRAPDEVCSLMLQEAVINHGVRLAHRIRDMQTLPYVVVTNPNFSIVYELYYKAFESLRRVPEIKTLDDNDKFCKKISQTLQEHLAVIPKLAIGVLECRDLMKPEDMDKFMNTILRSVYIPLPSFIQARVLIQTEDIPPDHSRAAPRPDGNLQVPLATP
jgi:hypothetical protein